MANTDPPRERLGEVTCPSGVLLLIDFGLLDLWCHDRRPRVPDGLMDPELTEHANHAADFRIDGPDAERAGRHWDRQWHPRYVFDIPRHGLTKFRQSFAAFVAEHQYDATLTRLPERVPHRTRVDLMLEQGRGAGCVFFGGLQAVAIGDVPTNRALPVYGQRMPGDDPAVRERWQWIDLDVRPESATVAREEIGPVAVDRARLMFADADALGAWEHEQPLDGLADFLFWGRDAATVAAEFDVPELPDGNYGWLDLPVRDAAERGVAIEEAKETSGWKFATDFRPHSHHYLLMRPVRDSETESGTLAVGGATVCGFMTSWGDGFFPVWRELDDMGNLVRVRIQLGDDDRVKLLYQLMK